MRLHHRLLSTTIVCLVLATPASAASVGFEVAGFGTFPGLRLFVATRWLGEDREVELRDDGLGADAVAGDHHWCAELTGDPVRALPVRIHGVADGIAAFQAYEGIEIVAADEDRLSWSLELSDPPNARRVAIARTTRSVMASEMTWVAAALGWANFVLVYVAWLGSRWLRGSGA